MKYVFPEYKENVVLGDGKLQLNRKSSNMGTGYEKSPHFAGIEKIL